MQDKIEQLAKLKARSEFLHIEIQNNIELQRMILERDQLDPHKSGLISKRSLASLRRMVELEQTGCSEIEADIIVEKEFGMTIYEIIHGTPTEIENKKKSEEIQQIILNTPMVAEFISLPLKMKILRDEISPVS